MPVDRADDLVTERTNSNAGKVSFGRIHLYLFGGVQLAKPRSMGNVRHGLRLRKPAGAVLAFGMYEHRSPRLLHENEVIAVTLRHHHTS